MHRSSSGKRPNAPWVLRAESIFFFFHGDNSNADSPQYLGARLVHYNGTCWQRNVNYSSTPSTPITRNWEATSREFFLVAVCRFSPTEPSTLRATHAKKAGEICHLQEPSHRLFNTAKKAKGFTLQYQRRTRHPRVYRVPYVASTPHPYAKAVAAVRKAKQILLYFSRGRCAVTVTITLILSFPGLARLLY